MEVGDLGHPGAPALLPVMEESRAENVFAQTPPPNMEERTALAMVQCLKCATRRAAPSVSIQD